MFISNKLVGLLEVTKDTVSKLREDLSAATAELGAVKADNISLRTTNEWMRHKINSLEVERAALYAAKGVKLGAVPEIAAPPHKMTAQDALASLNFEHIDEKTAKELGIEHLLS